MKKTTLYRDLSSERLRKFLLFMAFKFIILSVTAITVSASALSQARIDISFTNAKVETVIDHISQSTDYRFIYREGLLANAVVEQVNLKGATVPEILDKVLTPTGFTYEIDDDMVVIKRAPFRQSPQPFRISGKVTNQAGQPFPGAAVSVPGTTVGISADANGRFELTVPAGTQSFEVRFLGMVTQTITIGNQRDFLIMLEDDAAEIDDVVITGIFERSRESYTGAVTEISEKELKLFRGQNLIATISNIDPAVNLVSYNEFGSDPNRLPEINVRGNSSLPKTLTELNDGVSAQLNTPLVIMDGFSISLQKLMDFNDEDVESITILKDASATAIYGSRGANGVIVIKTKRPKEGNLRVQFHAGMNIEIPDLNSYNLMNSGEKLQLEYAAGLYTHDSDPLADIRLKELYAGRLAEVNSGVDTYWLSQPVRTGIGQRYGLQLMWGTDQFQVGTNIAYNDIAGVMKGSSRRTFSGNITLQYSYKNLIFRNQTMIDLNKAIQSPYGDFSEYAAMNPYWRIRDDEGNLIKNYTPISGSTKYPVGNPLYNAGLNTIDESKYTEIINNFSVEWKIMEGLNLRGMLGLSKNINSSDYFLPPDHTKFDNDTYNSPENFARKGSYTYGSGEMNETSGNLTLNYSKTFEQRHQVDAGIDLSLNTRKEYGYTILAEGFASDADDFFPNALQFGQGKKPEGSESISRSVGFTGFAAYSYDNRYFVDVSYRVDGSSLYGSKNRFAPFWSTGIGWNLHNEGFLKNNRHINRLRLRASIGETGSQQFNAYQALATYRYDTGKRYITWRGADLMALSNDELKWQTTIQKNLGVEFQVLNNRLSGTFDYYWKDTKDLLSNMDIPLAHGFSSYVANIGEVTNKGYEAGLSGYLVRNTSKNLIWTVTGKIAYNKNKITKLSDAIKEQFETYISDYQNLNFLEEGRSVNSIYAVTTQGIDPSTGRVIYVGRDGSLKRSYSSGDRVYCGTTDPKYRGNISTYLSYGNFSLNLSFAYHWGGQQYNNTLKQKVEVSVSEMANKNLDKRVYTDRWISPGDIKFFKGLTQDTYSTSTYRESRFVMDDNVFQLQSASVTYRWDSPFVKRMKMDLVNITANMSDLFYASSIKRERGTNYPFSRKFTLTVSFFF